MCEIIGRGKRRHRWAGAQKRGADGQRASLGSPWFLANLLAGFEPVGARVVLNSQQVRPHRNVRRTSRPAGALAAAAVWDKPRSGQRFMESLLGPSATHRDHGPDAVALVEAGILPASEGGILPPGWKRGLTGSQGWLPPQVRCIESVGRLAVATLRMAKTKCLPAILALFALAWLGGTANAAGPVSNLQATARDGQVFLTWKETASPDGTTFNVYLSNSPILDVAKATRIGHHIESHSARDWWEDPASFKKGVEPGKPVGFLIRNGGQRLDPADGLFVHTVRKNALLFFAVTHSAPAGQEETQIVLGANSLRDGVAATAGDPQPIWQRDGQPTAAGAGKDKPLWLSLHAKGGVVAGMEYLVFGDETMGWREGLPFKFSVRVERDEVVVRPTDRVWINRPHSEAGDAGTPAIWTFWHGYNSKIYDRQLMAGGVPTNYTERRNLWILDWVRRHYQPDPNRWYCSGSSMGGCGTISFGLRHPELFAACHAHVPIVSYTYLGKGNGNGSAWRLEPSCWTGPIPPDLKTSAGVPLLERMNGAKFVTEAKEDLPFLFLINGRQDGSIPWENNPPFYRALTAARQGFAAYWDNGTHPTSGKDAPEDVKAWQQKFHRFRLDESYPVLTHNSSNRNPGNGAADDGDLIGWINRGLDWKDIEDTPGHYTITLVADYPGLQYPVRADMTLRRVQQFRTKPGEKLSVRIGDAAPAAIAADANGRITVPGISIPSGAGVRVSIRR